MYMYGLLIYHFMYMYVLLIYHFMYMYGLLITISFCYTAQLLQTIYNDILLDKGVLEILG